MRHCSFTDKLRSVGSTSLKTRQDDLLHQHNVRIFIPRSVPGPPRPRFYVTSGFAREGIW